MTRRYGTWTAALAACLLVFAGCGTPTAAPEPQDVKAIIAALETSDETRPLTSVQAASVREDELVIVDTEGVETSHALPAEEFYLSIAPYVTGNHDCFNHSLATCQGELVNTEFAITITDSAGTVLVSQTATTAANGFAGFWVPRGITGTIAVEHEGLAGSLDFATTPGSPTCLTTLRLS